jgi:phosphoribosylaminoimidazole-succinocarboxamide synthase
VLQTSFDGLTRHSQGKVRDIYSFDDDPSLLLIVATDRISAFDYVLGSGIPDKGKVLTQISTFWFERMQPIVANHLLSTTPSSYPGEARRAGDLLQGRSMLVKRTEPLPIECVARGYLSGSGWKDYAATGELCGIRLPPGLRESDRLPEPIFTPATKAQSGHDENITRDQAAELVGAARFAEIELVCIELYKFAAEHAATRGIIIADTKFELGYDAQGTLVLGDEALTPDSSRFWPADEYEPGRAQSSFDKQFVRDYCEQTGWDKTYPGPELPDDVVAHTRSKYIEAFERLTTIPFEQYLETPSVVLG